MDHGTPSVDERTWKPLAGTQQAQITSEVVQLVRRHTGRGPTRSRTTVDDHVVVVVLRNVLTPMEHSLIAGGASETVRQGRANLHDAMRDDLRQVFVELTGHRPASIMACIDVAEDTACVVFTLPDTTA
ncbi:MAG: hypothetical protein V7636_1321, partial [Actinomycetota bacterium]